MTPTATSPQFESRPGHPTLRALAIVLLSAALTAGFLAEAWRGAPSSPAADDSSTLVHCAPGSSAQNC